MSDLTADPVVCCPVLLLSRQMARAYSQALEFRVAGTREANRKVPCNGCGRLLETDSKDAVRFNNPPPVTGTSSTATLPGGAPASDKYAYYHRPCAKCHDAACKLPLNSQTGKIFEGHLYCADVVNLVPKNALLKNKRPPLT
jgi:hypothetical protein